MDIETKSNKSLLQEIFNMINGRMDRLETKLDNNTETIGNISTSSSKRLDAAEYAIKRLEHRRGGKLDLSSNVIYILAVASLVILLIIAKLLNVNLGSTV